jgi:hypothetical protein
MADVVYNSLKRRLMQKDIDMANDTLKVMLVTSGYTPNADAHEFKSDVTGEVTGTGYTAGGQTLSAKSVTQDNTDDEGVFDAGDVTWTSTAITAHGAVIYKDTGVASTSPLVCYMDFGADKTTYDTDFKLQWSDEGILNVN